MSNILLAAMDALSWEDVRPFVKSFREHNQSDEVWIVAYRIKGDHGLLLKKFDEYNINIYEVNHDPYGNYIQHAQRGSPTQSHTLRLYHFWEILKRLDISKYGLCGIFDLRDIVFQDDVFLRIDNIGKLHNQSSFCIAASENITYDNEAWGKQNMSDGLGKFFYEVSEIGHNEIFNVGVMGGTCRTMRDICQVLYRMTERQYYPSDQSNWQVLISLLFDRVIRVPHEYGFACQCGTTLDPTKSHLWQHNIGPRPIWKDDRMWNDNNVLFGLIHQWDRVPELKQYFIEKYRD